MKVFLTLALCLASTSAFTKFESCKTLSSDKCFKTVLSEIKVDIGPDGTDDDVILEICSDYKVTDCCKTETLSSLLFDDWQRNNVERWGSRKFGSCKDKEFLVKNALKVTVTKEEGKKKDSLVVNNIELTTKPKDKKLKEIEQFRCGPMQFGTKSNPDLKVTAVCEPINKFHSIHVARFAMGPAKDDGTDDKVFVKICSDANGQCCEKRLHGTFSDDWHQGDIEKWDASYFGNCSKALFKLKTRPVVSISKLGKDSIKVLNLTLDMNVQDRFWNSKPKRLRTFCNDIVSFNSDCKTQALCSHTYLACRTEMLDVDPKSKRTIEKGAGKATRTTKKPKTTTTTTKKPTTTVKPGDSTTKKSLLKKIFGRRR